MVLRKKQMKPLLKKSNDRKRYEINIYQKEKGAIVMSKVKDYIRENSLKNPKFKRQIEVDNAKLDFAVRLAEQRKKAGMTQEELAKKIGKPQSTISRIETGEMNPTIELIIEISIGLDKQLSVEFK